MLVSYSWPFVLSGLSVGHRVAGWAGKAGALHLCPLMGGCLSLRRGDNPFPKNADGTIRYDSTHYKETWKALEALVAKGLVRALGLSNFSSRQIDDVLSVASVRPAVLQVSTAKQICWFRGMCVCKNMSEQMMGLRHGDG